jgi:RNA polymerase sigma factor (sigma-70 family)
MDDRDHSLDDILGQTAWIRGLARRLVADAAERDDVVQQVWVETLRKRSRARALRPWLFGVVRNVARTELRRDASRRAREEAAEPAAATPQPDELVERVELEREVATALLEIAEPYRSTLLLRYYEDLSPTEIAHRLKIPAGTVRWRLKNGLELLRANLDARFSGDRRRWALALVPTAAAARGGLGKAAIATIGGLLIMKVSTKVAAALVIVLAFFGGGIALWRHSSAPSEVSRARPGVAWRVPGGIGATRASPPTVEGVKVPSWFGQRGAPLRRIAGLVTFAGAPVANATVELASELTDAGLLRPTRIRTKDDGRFDFGTQPPAVFSVAATAEARSAAIVEVDTRDPRSAAERLELRLGGCESALSGHVSDSSGGPIVGAQVCLAPPRASACMQTDSTGAYRTCLTPRQNIIGVSASGYGAIYERMEYVGHRLQRDYVLAPEATLSGRVVRADTNTPIAQASIRVESADRAIRFAAPGATTTNEAGRFSIAGLAGGRYRVRAFAEGLATADAVEVNVEAGHPSGEVLLRLSPASRVSGVVTDGRDAIVGATVSLGHGPGSVDAITQSDGSFVLDPVAKGLATLSVRDYEVREPKTLKIDRSEVSAVRVLVDTMGSIAGRVTDHGKPAAGAQVFAEMEREAAIAELDGTYVIHGLPHGRYHVSAGDQTNSAFGKGLDLVLGKGEHRTGVDFEISYAGAISGVVVEPDGKPVDGAGVIFKRPDFDDAGRDWTAPDGTFRVRSLMGGGMYRAYVGASMLSNVPLKLVGDSPLIEVKDGTSEVSGVRLVVQRDHLAITGTTVDTDGQPLSDVRVVAYSADDPAGLLMVDLYANPSTISAADGTYVIENLDGGSYLVRARAGEGSEGLVRGVRAGQKNVVVTLQRAGAIDGTLVGFSSPPAVQALRTAGFGSKAFATVDGNHFHFAGLSPGSYQVAAIGAETDAKSVDVAAGQTATLTLQSRGTTTIRGRVVDFVSGAGVVGLRCSPGLRSAAGSSTSIISSIFAFSDDNGAFVLEGAPSGNISVKCVRNGDYWTDGQVELTVASGVDATCVVPVVKMDPDLPRVETGAVLDPSSMPTRFVIVQPHTAGDRAGIRAGDVIVTVDGANVASLTPMGVFMLVNERPAGTTVHLGLNRNGQPVTADLVIPSQ